MGKSRINFKNRVNECECCRCNLSEILTLHHLYPKRNGHQSKQTNKPRRERFLILCPNCHALAELGKINCKKILKRLLIQSPTSQTLPNGNPNGGFNTRFMLQSRRN